MIKNKGVNFAIAPEGVRRRKASDADDHGKNLAEFKKGPFHTTKNADCAFVPVCTFGANRLAPPGSFVFGQGTILIRILKAIPREVVRKMSVDELTAHTKELMEKAMSEYNDVATPEFLATKKWTLTMWGVFFGVIVQQYVEWVLFMWM